jgi:hypothetical protein
MLIMFRGQLKEMCSANVSISDIIITLKAFRVAQKLAL